MTAECYICGKGPARGNSIRQRGKPKYLGGNGRKTTGITKRWFKPNLQKIHIQNGAGPVHARVCTQCIRSGMVQKKIVRKPFTLPNGRPSVVEGAVTSHRNGTTLSVSAPHARQTAGKSLVKSDSTRGTRTLTYTARLTVRAEYCFQVVRELDAAGPRELAVKRFERVFSGFGESARRYIRQPSFNVTCESRNPTFLAALNGVVPNALLPGRRPDSVAQMSFNVTNLTATITVPVSEEESLQRFLRKQQERFIVERVPVNSLPNQKDTLGAVLPADAQISEILPEKVVGELQRAQTKETFEEVNANLPTEDRNRTRARLMILDTGFDPTIFPGEFDLAQQVHFYKWDASLPSGAGTGQPMLTGGFVRSNQYFDLEVTHNHGTQVAVRAAGKSLGIYRGAPLTIFALPYSHGQEGNLIDLTADFSYVLDRMFDAISRDYSNEPIDWPLICNLSLTFERGLGQSHDDFKKAAASLRKTLDVQISPNYVYVVAASGNRGKRKRVPLPARHDNVHSVGTLVASGTRPWKGSNSTISLWHSHASPDSLLPKFWAIGTPPQKDGSMVRTSWAAPVLAAKLLYCYHKGGISEMTRYEATLTPNRIRFRGKTVPLRIVVIC